MAASMSRLHLNGISRALYRVFVAPTLASPRPTLARICPLPRNATPLLPMIPHRARHYKAKSSQRVLISDYYTFDDAIEASEVNFIDELGTFHENVPLGDALQSYNKRTHHLLLVNPGTVNENGISDPFDMPTCKVITKIELRDHFQKKLEMKQREELGKSGAGGAKKLELNWAIAGGDLGHRLSRLQDFLREGRRVEVALAPKRRGKEATAEECDAVLKAIRDAVLDCKGAAETSKPEGAVGGMMTLFFQGRDLSEKQAGPAPEIAEEPPAKSKFREKMERKMREEEEKRRLAMARRAAKGGRWQARGHR